MRKFLNERVSPSALRMAFSMKFMMKKTEPRKMVFM